MTVDRAQQRIDVHERLRADPVQHRRPLREGQQVASLHTGELAGVAEGELPQQDPRCRRGLHTREDLPHPAGAGNVQVVDAVRAGDHSGDDRGQLPGRVRSPGPDTVTGKRTCSSSRSLRPARSASSITGTRPPAEIKLVSSNTALSAVHR